MHLRHGPGDWRMVTALRKTSQLDLAMGIGKAEWKWLGKERKEMERGTGNEN